MAEDKLAEADRQRAEVFDALGHPTRIAILKALNECSLGFADLKKKTGIESSGHLQHHLTKLNGLIKTDDYGKYCLSDEGKDALLTVQTVENASLKRDAKEKMNRRYLNTKLGVKPVAFILIALLIICSVIATYGYSQALSLHQENNFLTDLSPDATAYYKEFGAIVPIFNPQDTYEPPISMYQALIIGLQAHGWNKTSLQGFTVIAALLPTYFPELVYRFNYTGWSFSMASNSEWNIIIQKTGHTTIPPWDSIMVNATNGQIVPEFTVVK